MPMIDLGGLWRGWASADYHAQGFNSLAPGNGGESAWMRRLCHVTVKAPHAFGFLPFCLLPVHRLCRFVILFRPRLCRRLPIHRLRRVFDFLPLHRLRRVLYLLPFDRRLCRQNPVSTQLFKSMKMVSSRRIDIMAYQT